MSHRVMRFDFDARCKYLRPPGRTQTLVFPERDVVGGGIKGHDGRPLNTAADEDSLIPVPLRLICDRDGRPNTYGIIISGSRREEPMISLPLEAWGCGHIAAPLFLTSGGGTRGCC